MNGAERGEQLPPRPRRIHFPFNAVLRVLRVLRGFMRFHAASCGFIRLYTASWAVLRGFIRCYRAVTMNSAVNNVVTLAGSFGAGDGIVSR